jgi:ribosomal protein S18 acetylase RimI-like enzyme
MLIREAQTKDIPQIIEMGKKIFEQHEMYDLSYYKTLDNFEDLYRQWVENQINTSTQFIFVACDNEEITGFVSGYSKSLFPWFHLKTVGHISFLFVKENFRNKKIGTMLENKAVQWFTDKGLRYIELFVDEKNETGKKVWEKYGFEPFKSFLRKTII